MLLAVLGCELVGGYERGSLSSVSVSFNHALMNRHSRSTVPKETPMTSAASSALSPAK